MRVSLASSLLTLATSPFLAATLDLPSLGAMQIRRPSRFCGKMGCSIDFFATGLANYVPDAPLADVKCTSTEYQGSSWFACVDQQPYSSVKVFARFDGIDRDEKIFRFYLSHQWEIYGDAEGRSVNVTAQGSFPVAKGMWDTYSPVLDVTACSNATVISRQLFKAPADAPARF